MNQIELLNDKKTNSDNFPEIETDLKQNEKINSVIINV